MRSSRTSATLAAWALAASAGAATAADANVSADTQAQPAATAQADSRRAVRDKDTGKLRAPTSEEAEAMRAGARAGRSARSVSEPGAKTGPVRVVQHGGGMRSAVLGTEYLVTLKAQRRADGSLATTHNQPGLDRPVSHDVRPTE